MRKEMRNAASDEKQASKRLYSLKIEPFEPGLPIVEKYGAWLEYVEKVKKQFMPCRAAGESLMATVLYGAIGRELVEIINMKNYFPDASEVGDDFPFLESMLGGVGEYLKGLSDDSMNMNHLCGMKQSPGEQANDFLVRLHRQAKVCGIHKDEFIRTRFLEGLADRSLAQTAYQQGWKLDMILHAATRGEASGASVLSQSSEGVSAVAESSSGMGLKRKFASAPWSAGKRTKPTADKNLNQRCSSCNLRFHKNNSCPAVNKECRRCGRLGHFEAACKEKKVAAIATKSEIEPKVDIFE